MNIKVVAWDQGGVIFRSHLRPTTNPFHKYLIEVHGVKQEDIYTAYSNKKYNYNSGKGLIQCEEIFLKELEIDIPPEEMLKKRYEIEGLRGIYPEIVEYMWEIHNQWIRNSYFSNGTVYYIKYLEYMKIMPTFTDGFASQEHSLLKPEPAAFKYMEEKVSKYAKPSEILLIDDMDYNLEVAKDGGWQTIKFVSNTDLKENLVALGLLN